MLVLEVCPVVADFFSVSNTLRSREWFMLKTYLCSKGQSKVTPYVFKIQPGNIGAEGTPLSLIVSHQFGDFLARDKGSLNVKISSDNVVEMSHAARYTTKLHLTTRYVNWC